MATLKDILFYILSCYPNKDHLFNARVTKMIYLADWYSAVVFNCQVSPIQWYFNNYGPYVSDVIDTATNTPEFFQVRNVENFYGSPKRIIEMKTQDFVPQLTVEEKQAIDHVIDVTHAKTWDEFIRLVYSTYPIVASERYTTLDLVRLATEYRQKSR